MNQGIIDIASCMEWPAYYRVGGTDTIIFYYIPGILLSQISPA